MHLIKSKLIHWNQYWKKYNEENCIIDHAFCILHSWAGFCLSKLQGCIYTGINRSEHWRKLFMECIIYAHDADCHHNIHIASHCLCGEKKIEKLICEYISLCEFSQCSTKLQTRKSKELRSEALAQC